MTQAQKSARWASLFLLLFFVAVYSSCSEVTTLRCRRPKGECLLTQERLLHAKREVPIQLSDLLGAHMDTSSATSRGQATGCTVLETRQGPVQFEVWKSSSMADVSSDINDFLKQKKQPELEVSHDTRLGTFGAASFFLGVSVLLFGMSFSKSITTTGDRGR